MLDVDLTATHLLETVMNEVDEALSGAEFMMDLERKLSEQLMELGRAVQEKVFRSMDEGSEFVDDDGTVWREAIRGSREYVTRYGKIRVERGLYRARRNGPTRCLVDERLGIFEKRWTPEAARLAALFMTDLSSRRAARFFEELGGMKPSRTWLDKLPKRLWETMEPNREQIDAELRELYEIPDDARTVAVSLDGVMVKLQEDTTRAECVALANQQGRQVCGPIAYREASVGSLTFYDTAGNRLLTRRFARMPEAGKTTLEAILEAELGSVRARRPDLKVCALSDGAACNWGFLERLEPDFEVVDAYHTLEHIKRRLDRAVGVNSHQHQDEYARMQHLLLTKPDGHRTVFKRLKRIEKLAGTFKPRKRRGKGAQPTFYERHKARMRYCEHIDAGLPIGSGVIEGTARFMVVDRLRRSGMRWKHPGGQGVLTLRQYDANDQFDAAWSAIMRLEASNTNEAWAAELRSTG